MVELKIERVLVEDDGGDGGRSRGGSTLDLSHELIVERGAGGLCDGGNGGRAGRDAHEEALESQIRVLLVLLLVVLLGEDVLSSGLWRRGEHVWVVRVLCVVVVVGRS